MQTTIVELSLLAATIAGASRAIVTKFCQAEQKLVVVANAMGAGSCVEWIHQQPAVCRSRPVLLLDDNSYGLYHKSTKPTTVTDHIKRVAAFLIYDDSKVKYSLCIGNPSRAFFQDDAAVTALERIAHIMSGVLAAREVPAIEVVAPPAKPTGPIVETDPTLQFLLNTLLVKNRLLTRGDVSYMALRQWKRSIKPFQIKSMLSVKAEAKSESLDVIASEIASSTRSLYGSSFTSVVPVPGGSSGSANSFSVEMARRVATLLSVDFNNVLAGQSVPLGTSHPKKSVLLRPYTVLKPVKGNVLIIDDIATSGRHLELATQAIRQTASHTTAVVWIAD